MSLRKTIVNALSFVYYQIGNALRDVQPLGDKGQVFFETSYNLPRPMKHGLSCCDTPSGVLLIVHQEDSYEVVRCIGVNKLSSYSAAGAGWNMFYITDDVLCEVVRAAAQMDKGEK